MTHQVRWTHTYEAIVDMLLVEPTIKGKDIAARLGRSEAWISLITKSDAFQATLALRRKQRQASIDSAVTGKLTEVALGSLKVLADRIDANPASVPAALALDIADKTLERLGYGVQLPGVAAPTQVNVGIQLSPADFAHAQSIVRAGEREVKTIEADAGATASLAPSAKKPEASLAELMGLDVDEEEAA